MLSHDIQMFYLFLNLSYILIHKYSMKNIANRGYHNHRHPTYNSSVTVMLSTFRVCTTEMHVKGSHMVLIFFFYYYSVPPQ